MGRCSPRFTQVRTGSLMRSPRQVNSAQALPIRPDYQVVTSFHRAQQQVVQITPVRQPVQQRATSVYRYASAVAMHPGVVPENNVVANLPSRSPIVRSMACSRQLAALPPSGVRRMPSEHILPKHVSVQRASHSPLGAQNAFTLPCQSR